MPKPSIVIGLGGTGQKVLTYLKKELLETHNGHMPENVKLLAYDTMPEPELVQAMAKAGVATDSAEFQKTSIGEVSLEDNKEFYGLSGDGLGWGLSAASGEARHISPWFDAPHYLQEFGRNAWDLATGAGQVRQFGRLGFFMKADHEIYNPIQAAFQSAKGHLAGEAELEVIIVASFAGGTGAGMFVDMGSLCRSLASVVNNRCVIRGIFVFPRAFITQSQLGSKAELMQARSFAAWRELNRFMNVGAIYGNPKMTYRPDNNRLDFLLDHRPFDQVYLVDSKRDRNSLEVNSEKGVFQSIADFVSTVLDREAGKVYSQAAINLNADIKHGYTVFGTYSVKVPIYYAIRDYALNFSKELLELWLRPEFKNNKPVALMPDKNNQAGVQQTEGKDAVHPFLSATSSAGVVFDQKVAESNGIRQLSGTQLFNRIAEVRRGDWINTGSHIETDATGGFTFLNQGQIVSGSYLDIYTVLPADNSLTKINKSPTKPLGEAIDLTALASEMAASVWESVPPSKQLNEVPFDGIQRFRDEIPPFEKEHYGAGNFKGKFGDILDKARLFQLERFKEILQFKLNAILNGTSSDSKDNISGKLGYAIDFCEELVKTMDYFRDYITKVKERRAKLNLFQQNIDLRNATEAAMLDAADKKCMFFFNHPRAHATQEEYLAAVDEGHMIRKDDILLDVLEQTVTDLGAIAKEALESSKGWADHLVLGTQNISGMYRSLVEDIELNTATRQNDIAATKVQKLLEIDEYKEILTAEDPLAIEKALGRIHWEIDRENQFDIKLNIDVPTLIKNEQKEEVFVDKRVTLEFSDDPTTMNTNKDKIISIGNAFFYKIPQFHKIVDELYDMQDDNFKNPEKFAQTLLDNSHVLFDQRSNKQVSPEEHRIYVRVKTKSANQQSLYDDKKSEFVTRVVNGIRVLTKQYVTHDNNIVHAESEDAHCWTIVQTIDEVQEDAFEIWSEMEKSYRDVIQKSPEKNEQPDGSLAARLHIFPAECNAARYERKMVNLLGYRKVGWRMLHPRVVMLLEYAERISLFLRCWAYGFITKNPQPEGGDTYSLVIPAFGQYRGQNVEFLGVKLDTNGNVVPATMFTILDAFAKTGKDIVNGIAIDWEELSRSLNAREAQLKLKIDADGRSELFTTLRKQIDDEKGFVRQMQTIADGKRKSVSTVDVNVKGWAFASGQDYIDLADVSEMMLLEVIQRNTSEVTFNHNG